MTAGAGARRWLNDYGDIPWWYWRPRNVIVRQAQRDPHRWKRHGLMWALMLGALSP